MFSLWAVSLIAGAMVFCGLHELGHRLGPRALFGPVVSWAAAVTFTLLLLRVRRRGPTAFLLGAASVSSALVRLGPALAFLLGALVGRPLGDDEVAWGLGSPLAAMNARLAERPVLYLFEPVLCFWPMVSFSISAACLVLAYRHLFHLYGGHIPNRLALGSFALLPAGVLPLILLAVMR